MHRSCGRCRFLYSMYSPRNPVIASVMRTTPTKMPPATTLDFYDLTSFDSSPNTTRVCRIGHTRTLEYCRHAPIELRPQRYSIRCIFHRFYSTSSLRSCPFCFWHSSQKKSPFGGSQAGPRNVMQSSQHITPQPAHRVRSTWCCSHLPQFGHLR